MDDGYIHVSILKKPPVKNYLDVLWKLSFGSIINSKYYETIKCKNIKIPQKGLTAHIDGESVFFDDDIEISIIPKSIKILINLTK